jgi:hypothetical protein
MIPGAFFLVSRQSQANSKCLAQLTAEKAAVCHGMELLLKVLWVSRWHRAECHRRNRLELADSKFLRVSVTHKVALEWMKSVSRLARVRVSAIRAFYSTT